MSQSTYDRIDDDLTPSSRNKKRLGERAVFGLLWLSTSSAAHTALQIASIAVLARLLTPEDFGIVATAMIFISFGHTFAQVGVGPAIIQKETLTETDLKSAQAFSLLFGVGMFIMMLIIAAPAAVFFEMPELGNVLQVMGLVFVSSGASVVANSLLSRSLRFRELAIVDVFAFGIGYVGVSVAMGLAGFGIWSLAAGYIGHSMLKSTVENWLARPPFRLRLSWSSLKPLLKFGLVISAGRIWLQVATKGDHVILGKLLGAPALGIYERAYQLMAAPSKKIARVVNSTLFPSFAMIQNDRQRVGAAYLRAFRLLGLVGLPFSVVIYVLSPEIVGLLLGGQWESVVPVLQVFSVAFFFRLSYRLSDSLTKALGAVYRLMVFQFIYAVAVISGAAVGARWGITGAAVGATFGILVHYSGLSFLAIRLTGIRIRSLIVAHLPGLILSLAVGCSVWLAATVFRSVQAHFSVVLAIGAVSAAIAGIGTLRVFQSALLGADLAWIRSIFERRVPPRLRNLLLSSGA